MLVFRIAALAVFDWKSRMVSQSYPQLLGLTLLVLIGEILALVLIDLCDILVCPQFFQKLGSLGINIFSLRNINQHICLTGSQILNEILVHHSAVETGWQQDKQANQTDNEQDSQIEFLMTENRFRGEIGPV